MSEPSETVKKREAQNHDNTFKLSGVLYGVVLVLVLVLVPLGDGLIMRAVKRSLDKAGMTVTTSIGVGSSTPFPPACRGSNLLAFDTIWD
jgi:hypothetical protein